MSIVKLNLDDFTPNHTNNILDALDVMSDTELGILETCCSIILAERYTTGRGKIVNSFVMSQLEETNFEELLKC